MPPIASPGPSWRPCRSQSENAPAQSPHRSIRPGSRSRSSPVVASTRPSRSKRTRNNAKDDRPGTQRLNEGSGVTPRNGKNCTPRGGRKGLAKTPRRKSPKNPAIPGINHIRRKTSDKSFSPFHPRPKLIGENCAEGRYSEILSTRFVLSIVRCRERGRQAGANCAVIPPSRNLVLNRWSTVGSVHHRRCHFGPTRLAQVNLSDSHERACQKDRRG